MTNSTPHLIVWMAEYQKYLGLLEVGKQEEAAALKQEIEEGLEFAEMSWADLEFASEKLN